MAIWAVEELGAKSELPYAFLVGAILAGASGFAGGYLSDRIGRRRVILLGQGVMVGYPIVLLRSRTRSGPGSRRCRSPASSAHSAAPSRRRWSPTSSRRSGTRPRTRRCASRRTSASSWGRRSAGCCSCSAPGRCCSRPWPCSPRSPGSSRSATCPIAATMRRRDRRNEGHWRSSSPTGRSSSSSARPCSPGSSTSPTRSCSRCRSSTGSGTRRRRGVSSSGSTPCS